MASAATAFGIGVGIREAQATWVNGVVGYLFDVPAPSVVNADGATEQQALTNLVNALNQNPDVVITPVVVPFDDYTHKLVAVPSQLLNPDPAANAKVVELTGGTYRATARGTVGFQIKTAKVVPK